MSSCHYDSTRGGLNLSTSKTCKTSTSKTAKHTAMVAFWKKHIIDRKLSGLTVKAYCEEQVELLWDEVKRFHNPHNYYVDLSEKLWLVKRELLRITSEED